jgi:type III restriction enzyme
LVGGTSPTQNKKEIIINFEKMNKIIKIDKEKLADKVAIYKRGNISIYENILKDGKWEDKAQAKEVVEKERNRFLLKTPIDLVFTKGEPERKFIKELCETENAKKIESWLKSRDMNFYSIEYSITSIGGKHSKIQSFNPDFFIKLDNGKIKHFVIIEIKSDGDVSDENKAKLKYGVQHFKDLNKELEKLKINEKYHFHFLSPNSYDVFFDHLRKGILKEFDFRSDLEDQLLAKAD